MYDTGLACSPHDERNYAIRRTWRLASCCSSSLRSAAIVSTLFSSPCASAAQTNQLVPTSSNYLRALPYLELASTLLLCIRGELHDCLRAAALRLCGQHAYAHNHATQARGEACPGYSRDPPQQSHLQRNAQFLDDIFVGDVPRLRSTPGRNVKMAAHPYPYAAHLTLRYREKTATWGAHARPWRSSSPSMISSPTPHVDPSSCPSMRLGVGRQPTIP